MHASFVPASVLALLFSGLLLSSPARAADKPKPAADAAADEDDPFVGFLKPYKNCRARYAEMDARVEAAGVSDAGYYRVPGFPYFRTDRLLASFANEVQDLQSVAGWTRRMRESDQEARETEYYNLGLSQQERAQWRYDLLACGGGLTTIELLKPENLETLRKAVAPKSEYIPATTAGASSVKLQKDIQAHDASVLKAFTGPLPATTAPLRLWRVKPVEDMTLIEHGYGRVLFDELGVPGLIDSQWRALAEANAPVVWIESASERDKLGTPAWSKESTVAIDTTQPKINYQITFTRFGSSRLAQINYFIWFKGRTREGGGEEMPVDGLIWRVTLDDKAQPLTYDSVHATGRDHLWFLAQPMPRRNAATDGALFPQAAALIKGPVALRLRAGSHEVIRVVGLDLAKGDGAEYELARYEDLFTLPLPGGGSATRNIYDGDGIVSGVPQQDLAWLWGNRIAKPGSLRELGRLPISYTGQDHFDDALAMEKLFVVPASKLGHAKGLNDGGEPPADKGK